MSENSYRLSGTRLRWTGIRGWIDTVYEVDRSIRPSSAAYARAKKLHRALAARDIHLCTDAEALEDLESLLRQARCARDCFRHGPGRSLTRSELGDLIVETVNQRRWVARGCPPAREKGPRLDPAMLPDQRLDVLIQSHPDVALVERLREEKRQREARHGTNILN